MTHLCPVGTSALTPCCQKSIFDLPRTDQVTNDETLVTCSQTTDREENLETHWNCNRRDMCHFVGSRASLLTPDQAAQAWHFLAGRMEEMGEMDIPKFKDLITSVRAATIWAKRKP